MTEEINYSYDGGLYAELVSNRTFQTNRGLSLEHWTLIQTAMPELISAPKNERYQRV
jgi:alpha-N-arabinofuranosidase